MTRFFTRSVPTRRPAASDEGAALITAMLLIMVVTTFSLVMLGVILSQIKPTQVLQASTKTVFAAESGINAVVGQIRNARGTADALGNIYGDRTKLPCTATGTVEDAGGEVAYEVQVSYFNSDPTGQSDAWRAANKLSCTSGSGPSQEPGFALLSSSGKGLTIESNPGDISRTLEVVYAFNLTNVNIPGGYIYSWSASYVPDRFCLEATSQVSGANVKYVPTAECGDRDPLQLWIYDTDYRIKLATTTIDGYTGDVLCITRTNTAGQNVELKPCESSSSSTRYLQLWSWTGDATWRGETSALAYANYYLGGGSGNVTSGQLLKSNSSVGSGEAAAFDPLPSVGAGAAGKTTNQIVNYLEFGRCADVTWTHWYESQMIVYPCKQDPNPSQSSLLWNHKWYYTEPALSVGSYGPQTIRVNTNSNGTSGTNYCLKSAGTEGGWVTFSTDCSSTSTKWTRYADTGNYQTSYLFKDSSGRCLDLGPALYNGQEPWSTMVTKTCNTSLSQKWNAPPDVVTADLSGYWEYAWVPN
ncbi:hypothetical protein [Demequina iriomotensis]|uniref:hypothetical protein n=1 Tax=Demequina iriomotensis TaxID=1536641 RepID=UPI0007818BAB|nr:hypothetical protein [Demequina iriomotensis]